MPKVHLENDPSGEYWREAFQAGGQVTAAGKFEILAITAGEGNGWRFAPGVLRASLEKWRNVESFIDHDLKTRSVRDLAGMLQDPAWCEEKQGITAVLAPVGPSAPLLQEMARVILSGGQPKPDVGFSADILFQAKDRAVTHIVKVLSVDLVIDPARGGQFLRALNAAATPDSPTRARSAAESREKARNPEENPMPDEVVLTTTGQGADEDTFRKLLQVQTEQQRLAEEAEKTRAVRVQMCEYLLSSGLSASRLPQAAADRVRKQFAGRVFEPAELQAAIEDTRKLVSELTAGAVVQGPGALRSPLGNGRIHGMMTSEDQLQVAVDDLLGAPRDSDKKDMKAARLSGIRELYLTLTGDYDLHGGYYSEHVQLATTVDFAGLVKNALNKIVVQKWGELGAAGYDWWSKIAVVEHFNSLQSITGTLVGTVGSLPSVAEGAAYTELAVGDSPETAAFVKYGGYIPLTLELIDRDETRKLAAYPREMAVAGIRKISELVAAIFSANAGVGPTLADSGALFNAGAVATAGGHANLLTTALSAAQWEVVSAAVYNQPLLVKNAAGYYGAGPKMGVNPRYLLVPRALQLTAKQIVYPSMERAASIFTENLQQGQPGDVVTVPDWTDANDWAAACDPNIAPAIFIGERFGIMPQIFIAGDDHSPAVFTNDEHRLKVRHFLAVWVNDFRPLHKENVA